MKSEKLALLLFFIFVGFMLPFMPFRNAFALPDAVINASISGTTSASGALLLDKESYIVGDTVIMNITIPEMDYANFSLKIYSRSNNYTYRGEFNQIMFFYPMEEDIYTVALVERSTGASIYQATFSVVRNDSPAIYAGPALIEVTAKENGSDFVFDQERKYGLLNISVVSDASKNGAVQGQDYSSLFFLEKNEYIPGETVKLMFDSIEEVDVSNLRLYYSYAGKSELYMSSLGFIEFLPKGIGEQELVLVDAEDNVLQRYPFTVLNISGYADGGGGRYVGNPPYRQKLVELKDRYGEMVNSSFSIHDARGMLVQESEFVASQGEPEWIRKKYSLEITPVSSAIDKIILVNVSSDGNMTLPIGFEEISPNTQKMRGKDVRKAYAIDASGIRFTSGMLVGTAVGDELWKCREWDFQERRCRGNWTKVLSLVRGREYNITITPEDPAFIEIIPITAAMHLDENRSLISDITGSVILRDSEYAQIPDSHFVRVFFEENLTSQNDITLYARSNSSNASIIVYEEGKSQALASFLNIAQNGKYKVMLDNLTSPQASFDLQVISSDGLPVEIDYIVDPRDLLPAGTRQGMIVYGESNITIPRYRIWNGTSFGPELNATSISQIIEWVRVESSPVRDEYMLVTADNGDDVNVQMYSYINSTTICWHRGNGSCGGVLEFTAASSGLNRLKADIAYEQVSGDALVVYLDRTRIPKFRIWNGTNWTAAANVSQTNLTTNVTYIKLAEQPNSDELALLIGYQTELSVIIWNGTAWSCEPSGLLSNSVQNVVYQTADLAYEQKSGDLFIGSITTLTNRYFNYTVKTGVCTFASGGVSFAGVGASALEEIDVAARPESDYVMITGHDTSGNDIQSIIWNGTTMINLSFADTTILGTSSPNLQVASGWAGNSSTGVSIYADSVSVGAIAYMTYNATSTVWTGGPSGAAAGLHTTGTGGITNFTSSVRSIQSYSYLDERKLMAVFKGSLAASPGLWAKYYSDLDGRWYDADGGVALELNSSSASFPSYDFAWAMSSQRAPSVFFSIPTDNSSYYVNRTYIQINITANDTNLKNISVFVYNSSGSKINSSNTSSSVLTNLWFNLTGLAEGLYYFNATACDQLGNCNQTETRNVSVDLKYPSVNFTPPTENSSLILNRSYIMINVSANDTFFRNITIYIYNITGLYSSSTSTVQVLFWNATSIPDGIYYFNASASDNSGKVNWTATRNVTIDTAKPSIGFNSPTDVSGSIVGRNYTFMNVTANDTHLANITISLFNSSGAKVRNDTAAATSVNFSFFRNYTGLAEGMYFFNASAYDTAGNYIYSETKNITLDLNYPAVFFVWPTDNNSAVFVRDYIQMNVTATDLALKNITIRIYNSSGGIIFSNFTGNFSIFYNATGLAIGSYYFNSTACDYMNRCNSTETRAVTLINSIKILSILVDDNTSLPVNEVDLAAGSVKRVYCNISVQDVAGYPAVAGLNSSIYLSTVSYDSVDDNRTHYTNNSCNRTYAFGNDSQYLCNFDVWYYASNGSWICRGQAWDNFSVVNATDDSLLNKLFALNVSNALINYSKMQPETTSQDINVNITNLGNVPINITVYGFGGESEVQGANLSMICNINNISISFQKFSTTVVPYGAKTSLSSAPKNLGFTIPPQSNSTDLKINTTYWQLMVPASSYTLGECNGSIVFMATAS
jgi:hypothetical protein